MSSESFGPRVSVMAVRYPTVFAWVLAAGFAVVAGASSSAYFQLQGDREQLRELLADAQSQNVALQHALRRRDESQERTQRWISEKLGGAIAETPGELACRDLLGRIRERLDLMHDVARWKWNAEKPIDDLDRERELLDRVVAKATEMGIDATFARSFFEDQIDAAKIVQRDDFARWTAVKATKFDSVPDLTKQLRPQIDSVTDKILESLSLLQKMRDPATATHVRDFSNEASREFGSPADPVRRSVQSFFQHDEP